MRTRLLFLKKAGRAIVAKTTILSLTALSIFGAADAQTFEWVRGMGGNGTNNSADKTWALALDGEGNAYVAGAFESNSLFGNTNLSATGSVDAFLAKYDTYGDVSWAVKMGGPSIDEARTVVADDSGFVYVAGMFQDSITFNNNMTLHSTGGRDIFMAKYSNTGNFVWAKKIGGTGSEVVWGMSLDHNNDFYITGQFTASADFDPDPANQAILTGVGAANAFLAKYNDDGELIWAKNMGGTGGTLGYSVAVDSENNVYATGNYEGNTNFNLGGTGGLLTPYANSADIFIVKYSETGNFIWVKGVGGNGGDMAAHIAIDGSDNVYVTGFYGLIGSYGTFDPGNTPSVGTVNNAPGGIAGIFSNADLYLAKYDKNGNFLWVNSIGSIDSEESWGLAIDRSANVYVSGSFEGTVDFDPSSTGVHDLTATGVYDIFLAKYDSTGAFLSAKQMGSAMEDRGFKVAVDGSGNIFQTGFFRSTADFNIGGTGGEVSSNGHYDGFLVKFMCSDTSSSSLDVVECGASYTFNGITYTNSGTYVNTYANRSGCDSTVTLNLTILNFEAPLITINGFELGVVGTFDTYQWILNGTDIPGATNSTHTATQNGDYQVRVSNTQDCEGTSEIYTITNSNNIKNRNTLADQIEFYPNPSSDAVSIVAPIEVNVSISGLDGRILNRSTNARSIDISDLAAGAYIIRFTNKDGNFIKADKLIKK